MKFLGDLMQKQAGNKTYPEISPDTTVCGLPSATLCHKQSRILTYRITYLEKSSIRPARTTR